MDGRTARVTLRRDSPFKTASAADEDMTRSNQPARAAIMGTGGYAVELYDVLAGSGIEIIGFIGPRNRTDLPKPWLGLDDRAVAELPKGIDLFIAVAEASARRRISDKLRSEGRTIATFIHPTAWVAASVRMGDEVIVYPNSTVHANVHLGRGVLVNSNVTIGHDAWFGAFCNINPGVAIGGHVNVGDDAYIGMGAVVKENVRIEARVVVGAGATVVCDLPYPGPYIGTPARLLSR